MVRQTIKMLGTIIQILYGSVAGTRNSSRILKVALLVGAQICPLQLAGQKLKIFASAVSVTVTWPRLLIWTHDKHCSCVANSTSLKGKWNLASAVSVLFN